MLRSTGFTVGLGSLLLFAGCASNASSTKDFVQGDAPVVGVTSGGATSGGDTPGVPPGGDTPGVPPGGDTGAGSSGSSFDAVAVSAGSGSVDVPPSTGTETGSGGASGQSPGPGALTAGDWDDNLNFDFFLAYVSDHLQSSPSSAPFLSADRVVIRVASSDDHPISNALVTIADTTKTYLSAPTGSDGRLLFFPTRDGAPAASALTVTVQPPAGQTNVLPLTVAAPAGAEWGLQLPGATSTLPTALDLAFVIDTTGSMGDEISYLQAEVQGIADSIQTSFPQTSIHFALILYRDRDMGDEYITRVFDFTADLPTFEANLQAQSADGGGDTPEAMEEAMAEVPGLAWRGGDTARVSFLIADAPPHDFGYVPYLKAVEQLRPLGIRLYPVGASGVDPEAEYLMRLGAEDTLGRYLFLTDDSGIGDSHMAPHIPCYEVEKLSKLLYRAIASELTGARLPSVPTDVIRSVGEPMDGVCTLPDGTKAYL